MDVATIAVTNDHRARAVLEPVNTAKVYNAYKQLLRDQLADTPALQALLPPDKGWRGVAANFTRLATSIAANNVGDSIQRPAPAYEARPRLPRTGPTPASQGSSAPGSRTTGHRDSRPRFVVRSGFDVRRFAHDGDPVTDLTVRVALRDAEDRSAHVAEQLTSGVEEFLNAAGHRLPNGDRLHVTVEFVDPSDAPHLTVDLVGRDRAMDQNTWWVDAAPVQLVHELTHQLGLRDEYRDADVPHRPHVLGSLLGDLDVDPEDSSLATAGLRDRHLALLGALIGDVSPAPEEAGRSFEEARGAAVPDTREAVWVDPVSLPRPAADDATVTDVPARMPQDTDAVPAVPEPALRSFRMGNYEFTNLNQTDRYVDRAIRIVELLDEHATIRDYVGGRPVRITLRLRTTEAPADVIDRGDDGVDINLASYYFEKYDTGYLMGMLAHEIGLHPLASRNRLIAEEENLFAGMPLTVPGLESLREPRFMNTEGSGQADHVMAAFPQSIRHGIYRDVIVEMAGVLEQRARVGVEGAKAKDVTDLFDTYLMDLASIAVTNDHRARAITDPSYTARVYNAYKAQLDAHLPQDSRLRALLPADKGRWGVLSDFAQLATSVGTNNRGDSIQRPAPTDEARPRLPRGRQTQEGAEPDGQVLTTGPLSAGTRDGRPRFVVRSGFDARRFTHDGDPVTDLTVRVAMRGADGRSAHVFGRLSSGVEEFLNDRGYRLPSGDRLHVTVELVDVGESPHLTVDLVGRDEAMDQNTWWVDAAPVQLVHELTHQLGLRDEYRDADSPHRPHILGSLLGDLDADPEDSSLVAAGLRDRHLALLGALIGDVAPAPEEAGLSFAEARGAAVADTREAVWVDPVSLPQPADGDTGVGVPARMTRGEGLRPFGSGNFTFTNLNYENDAYLGKAIRVIQTLLKHSIIDEYVAGRPVRITLHVRTTETPADVIDLDVARQDAAMRALEAAADSGDAEAAEAARAELADALVVRPAAEMRGVEINLASYYFEKYDIGYVMGMLAHEIGLHPLASARDGLGRDEADNRGVDQRVPGLPANRVMNTTRAGQADHVMAASPERMRHRIYRDVVVEMARVLAQQAANRDEGAGDKDVTDLFDTYLMDVATIAVTNDHRAKAVLEPFNTAKVYNAYKQLLRDQLADTPALQALLPSDKGVFGVAGNFTRLATSIATDNTGDSIQRPAPAYEARPRLPQTDPAPALQGPSLPGPRTTGHRDSRPRFVVRSSFDVRRFPHRGETVTDLTVRVALRGAEDRSAHVAEQLTSGVEEFLNAAGHRLPNGDRWHVTVEFVDPSDAPHLTVDLVGRDRAMDQNTWWVDAAPVQLVHELTHQLGLRDEYRDADAPHRPHILGSLLGDLDADPEDSSLDPAGLRGRHLALLGALIGDVTPAPEEAGLGFAEARSAAVPDTREALWVDPVSLPAPAEGRTEPGPVPVPGPGTDIDADAAAAHAAADAGNAVAGGVAPRMLVPFKSGNFEFTNLKHTNERYRDRAVRIIELLRGHDTIREYVGGRPVRITLQVRTTETPADVIDRDAARLDAARAALAHAIDAADTDAVEAARAALDALAAVDPADALGVDINLASYYFEKYDIGYVMGMLAHEIGLHPLASRNTGLPDEEAMFENFPLPVPGLEGVNPPRTMSTEGAGQADHIMAAYQSSTRHRVYREIVLEMARTLARDARNGEENTKPKDVTDLFDCYLMDLASIAVTNDHRLGAAMEPGYTAKVYNAYKKTLHGLLENDPEVLALLPPDKGMLGVINDFRRIGTSVSMNNRGDSIQRDGTTN
ncbi:hypothetical protein [Streptomyces sp. NPDC003401]